MEPIIAMGQYIISIFNPEEVFASLTNFLGSGYVVIAVVAILAYGILKRLVKLGVICGVVFLIWLVCTTGTADQIIEGLYHMFSGIIP